MTRELKGKLYRKAFITLHTAAFPNAPTMRTEAQAKKWAQTIKPNAGKELVLAVDAIRSVIASSVTTGVSVKARTRGGSQASISFRSADCEIAMVYVTGQTRYSVTESVSEVRALISRAMQEAVVA